MNNTKNKNAVIYCRVSTKEQVEEGNSLVTQESLCREFAIKNGYEILSVFIEQGESAKTTHRTEFQKLLTFCTNKKNAVNAVITYKIDRIARNSDDYSQIRLLLKRYSVEIKSTTENFEDTPAGRFMENIIANVAQFDNDVRTERSINGMKGAVREGRYVWTAPTGYSNTRISGKATIAHSKLAHLVQEAFEEVAKGLKKPEEIRKSLLNKGLKSNLNRPLSKSQFYAMLKNKLYAGWIIKFGECHKGLFEPIISDELFDQVQRVLKFGERRERYYLRENPNFPLRRFIKHPSGIKLTGSYSQGRSGKYPYYRFRNEKISYRKEILERQFCDFLDTYKIDPNYINRLKELVAKQIDKLHEDKGKLSKEIEAQISELKTRQSLLIQKNIQAVISDSILKEHLGRIEEELFKLTANLYNIPTKVPVYESLLDDIREILEKPSICWANSPFTTRIKLQWFYFPQGIVLNLSKCRTTKKCSPFKAEKTFCPLFSYRVPRAGIEPARHCWQEILSLSWLPISPPGQYLLAKTICFERSCSPEQFEYKLF